MKQQKHDLITILPLGQFTSRLAFLEQGFSSHTLDNYLKSGVLKSIVSGVYMRQESKLTWQGAVASIPSLVEEPVTAGGLTALELQGFAQYLSLNTQRKVHLYSASSCPVRLKAIFKQLDGVELCWHRTARLWMNSCPEKAILSEYTWREDATAMVMSSPEQAILELLMTLPEEVSFEHAEQLMQGLTQLSPRKLDALLKDCKSVKVKRLFFWLADRFNYPWRKKLDANDYNLGSGKRVIAKEGKLDTRYNITVPKSFAGELTSG